MTTTKQSVGQIHPVEMVFASATEEAPTLANRSPLSTSLCRLTALRN